MTIHPLTDRLSVAPQIALDDVAAIAAAGFRTLINNRPDGEADGQPDSASMAAAAARHGLAYRHVPVISGQLSAQDVVDFTRALHELPAPVLAYCRTGTRSTTLWALQADGSADDILATARSAGYDLAALRPHLGEGGAR